MPDARPDAPKVLTKAEREELDGSNLPLAPPFPTLRRALATIAQAESERDRAREQRDKAEGIAARQAFRADDLLKQRDALVEALGDTADGLSCECEQDHVPAWDTCWPCKQRETLRALLARIRDEES